MIKVNQDTDLSKEIKMIMYPKMFLWCVDCETYHYFELHFENQKEPFAVCQNCGLKYKYIRKEIVEGEKVV